MAENDRWQSLGGQFHRALRWLLGKQNQDGSWGRTLEERVSWTSNIVISLSVQLEALPTTPLRRAIDFLLSNEVKGYSHWILRIPALLPYYTQQQYQDDIRDLRIHLPAMNLFFRAALLTSITDPSLNDMRIELANELQRRLIPSSAEYLVLSPRANQNTLYSLFLLRNSEDPHIKSLALKTLRGTRYVAAQEPRDGEIRFNQSNGISAYVGINLLDFHGIDEGSTDLSFFVSIAHGFQRDSRSGCIHGDIAGHQPFKSVDAIYTTSLYIRYISKIAESFDEFGRTVMRCLLAREMLVPHNHFRTLVTINVVALLGNAVLFAVFIPTNMSDVIVGSAPGTILAVTTFLYTIILDRSRVLK